MVEKFSKHTPDQIVHRLKKTRQSGASMYDCGGLLVL